MMTADRANPPAFLKTRYLQLQFLRSASTSWPSTCTTGVRTNSLGIFFSVTEMHVLCSRIIFPSIVTTFLIEVTFICISAQPAFLKLEKHIKHIQGIDIHTTRKCTNIIIIVVVVVDQFAFIHLGQFAETN